MKYKFAIMAAVFAGLAVLTAASAQAGSCSNASYQGIFSFTSSGTIQTPNGPIALAVVGRYSPNGAGHISGSQTASAGGKIFRETFSETYAVNADCTGSSTKTTSSGITVHTDFVITSNLNEVQSIQTDPGRIVTVVAKKTFHPLY